MSDHEEPGLTFSRVLAVRQAPAGGDTDLLRLARDRAPDPSVFDTLPPYFFGGEISSSRWDAYDTSLQPSSLRNFASEAETGVAVLRGHDTRQAPIGHSLTGRYVGPGGNGVARVEAEFYVLADEDSETWVNRIRAGAVRDLSVGFYGGEWLCTICGKDMQQWLSRDGCFHLLGMVYTPKDEAGTKKGEPEKARAKIENAHLAEFSPVYDGATPGAMIAKARGMAAEGLLPDGERELVRVRYRLAELPGPARFWRGTLDTTVDDGLPDGPAPDGPAPEAPEAGRGGTGMADERTTAGALPEPVLSRFRELGMPATEADPHEWAARELTGLRALADDGRQYRADLVTDALAEGVRAFGEGFAQDTYRALLESAPLATVKRLRDDWRGVGDGQFTGGRVTQDQGEPLPGTATAERLTDRPRTAPAGAYQA